jgi:hypothetical protein
MPLDSDLAPIYGSKAEHAGGMTRETLAEVRAFYASRLAELDRVSTNCAGCAHSRGRVCKKFDATMPVNYTGDDCPEWQYDGIPY